jgi:hypothetical protein
MRALGSRVDRQAVTRPQIGDCQQSWDILRLLCGWAVLVFVFLRERLPASLVSSSAGSDPRVKPHLLVRAAGGVVLQKPLGAPDRFCLFFSAKTGVE